MKRLLLLGALFMTAPSLLAWEVNVLSSLDVYVEEHEVAGNRDTWSLWIKGMNDYHREAYVVFSLAGYTAPVARARLELYVDGEQTGVLGAGMGVGVFGLNAPIDESIAWQNKPGPDAMQRLDEKIIRDEHKNVYVGWDVGKFVNARIGEGASTVAFRVAWTSGSRGVDVKFKGNQGNERSAFTPRLAVEK